MQVDFPKEFFVHKCTLAKVGDADIHAFRRKYLITGVWFEWKANNGTWEKFGAYPHDLKNPGMSVSDGASARYDIPFTPPVLASAVRLHVPTMGRKRDDSSISYSLRDDEC